MTTAGSRVSAVLTRTATVNSPALISASRIVIMVMALATAPIVARELGPAGRGIYAACIGALGIAPVILGLGLPMVIRRRAAGGPVASTLRTVQMLLPLMVVLGVAGGAALTFTTLRSADEAVKILLMLCMAMAGSLVYSLCVQSILINRGAYRSIALLQVVQGVMTSAAIVVLWIFSHVSVESLLATYIVATAVSGLIAWRTYHQPVFGTRAALRPLMRDGLRFAGSQIAETAAAAVPLILAVVALGAYDAGLFSVAITIATIPLAFGYAIGTVIFKSVASSEGELRKSVETAAMKAAVIVGGSVVVLIAAATPIAIPLLFGEQYRSAVVPTVICTCGALFTVLNYVGMQMLAAEGRAVRMTFWQTAGLTVSVVGLFVLGSHWGAVGASIGAVLGWSFTSAGTISSLKIVGSLLSWRISDIKTSFRLVLEGQVPGTL